MAVEHFDVLIVGAGLSGIGAAARLTKDCPQKTYAVLEQREAIGGTWDLFRYPGIRSDSDMYTLGYSFKPWINDKVLADGDAIRDYVKETAREYNVEKHIRFRHKVKRLSWSSSDATWTVDAERDGETVRFTCNFFYNCSGYYSYNGGYTPDFPGIGSYQGQVIHPQKWPDNFDYAGKRVVVIGSGATAITLVPAMTDKAAHVTMLQRSPTYVMTIPSRDWIARNLRKVLPESWAYTLTRWKNVLMQMVLFNLSRKKPQWIRALVRSVTRKELGKDYPVDVHFKPKYNPWDQRFCVVPDSDLFKAIRRGKASMVTDHIETFNATGIRTKSGQQIDADIVITATGLVMKLMEGIQILVDGHEGKINEALVYKGMMVSDVPNLAMAVGYTNASWTLKCDLIAGYVCRLLNHMDREGYRQCTPRRNDPSVKAEVLIDFSSGYFQRAANDLPKQGNKQPWKLAQNYFVDTFMFKRGSLHDGAMEFSNPQPVGAAVLSAAK